MADTTIPAVREAYYAKEQLRILRVKLEAFRVSLKACTIPSHKMWLEGRINELATALFERTGIRY
jgi:hypothetical protein